MVETVGVGQSETAVADMVDMFLLLLSPGGGDELQGIKRGIMELADLVIVNKADGDLAAAAQRAANEYTAALHLMRPKASCWTPAVTLASALNHMGLEDIWQKICDYQQAVTTAGTFEQNRALQAVSWMWSEIDEQLHQQFHERLSGMIEQHEAQVRAGETPPTAAARALMADFLQSRAYKT